MLRCFFHPRAEKELARVPVEIQKRIIAKLKEVCRLNHPLQHKKVKKLRGRRWKEFRLRVGEYRVKFLLTDAQAIKFIFSIGKLATDLTK